jgi:hypothetical protein
MSMITDSQIPLNHSQIILKLTLADKEAMLENAAFLLDAPFLQVAFLPSSSSVEL